VTVVDVLTLPSDQLDIAMRADLRMLWARAFGERFDDHDADHAYGGVHVLTLDDDRLVAHASAVPRRIQFGDRPWCSVGYVEAVATDPERQGEGIGRRTMQVLQREIAARWPVAMLSTGRATGFYESLGWERWRGVSSTLTSSGVVVRDGEHGGLMILRPDRSVVPDLSVIVTCEDRHGDAW
jgi:aminoglycoside 2'-N-acetyltransferase I